jgi:hypothetical protein
MDCGSLLPLSSRSLLRAKTEPAGWLRKAACPTHFDTNPHIFLRASAVPSSIRKIKITAETQRPLRDRKAGTMTHF